MLLLVEPRDRARHATEISGYYRLRKKVFFDRLRWDVPVVDDEEHDILDEAPCTYILSVNTGNRVEAGLRLIPTTQTTLLEMAFDGLVPDAMSFKSPTIWEISRLCVDDDPLIGTLPGGINRATLSLVIAGFDYAWTNGITHYLTVTEERMLDLTRLSGLNVETLGRMTTFDCRIVCGLFAITPETRHVADRMRALLARGDLATPANITA